MKKVALVVALSVVMMVAVAGVASANGTNLVTNGDFEAGNTGFVTEYQYLDPSNTGSWTLGPPYMYTIGTNPGLYHSAWMPGFGDHTSGVGKMMIVNGTSPEAGEPNKLVWGQEVTLECVPVYPVSTYPLYAGQTWEVGEVQVKTSADGICVRFVLTDSAAIAEGWVITEAHVAVGDELGDIPQTKKGNPIPGQFPVNVPFDPGVIDTDWLCLDYDWTAGVPLIVAAHAKLELPELGHMEAYNFCVTSNPVDTDVVDESGVYLKDAVVPAIDPWGNLDVNVGLPAEYLWDALYVTGDTINNNVGNEADTGSHVNFAQLFDIMGTPTSATFRIAADNAFAFSFNYGDETAENLAEGWRDQIASGNYTPTSPNPLGEPVVVIDANPSGWSQVYAYDVLDQLVSGQNILNVTGVNADWNTTSPTTNPACVIYKLCVTSEEYVVDRPYDDETGWGGDCGEFDGKNWATYICYTPEVECDYGSYLLEFYVASTYPAAPAQLEVRINDVVVPPTLEATSTVGEWVKYSATWDAGTATTANIEIRDLRYTYSGDDFVIDDISFVKQ